MYRWQNVWVANVLVANLSGFKTNLGANMLGCQHVGVVSGCGATMLEW